MKTTKDKILRAIEELDEKAISYYLYGNEKTISEVEDLVPKYVKCVVVPGDWAEDYKLYLAPENVVDLLKILGEGCL